MRIERRYPHIHTCFNLIVMNVENSNVLTGGEVPVVSEEEHLKIEEGIEHEVTKTEEEIAAAKRAKSKKKQVT